MAAEDHPEQLEIQFEVELGEGKDWGVKLTSDLQILSICDGGPFDGKCTVGDQIVQVNESPVKTIGDFEQIIQQSAGSLLQIQIARELRQSEVNSLPPEYEKNVQRRDGYSYHLLKIVYQRGHKLGLSIKHFHDKVLVSRVEEGSLSAKALALGDRIITINRTLVSDKDVARNMLVRSLQKFRTVSLVIERAESVEAKDQVTYALQASEMQPPSVAMASDIQDIIKRQKQKMQQSNDAPKKTGIIRKASATGQERHVSITSAQKEVVIATDHEGKVLKHIGSGQK